MVNLNLTVQYLYDYVVDLLTFFNLKFNIPPFISFSIILSQNKLKSHNFVDKSSTSKSKGGKKKKKTSNAKKVVALTGSVKKPNDKCFYCKILGHWKTYYSVFLATQKTI